MDPLTERSSFTVGERASLTHVFTDTDIIAFAQLSKDTNPIHLIEEYANKTWFGGRIVHGMLVASLISSVLGNQLPGPGAIYLNQNLRFLTPVRPGDKITVNVEIINWDPQKGRVKLLTDVINQVNEKVVTGEAELIMASFIKK